MNKTVSPSRTYVAMCAKTNGEGYYFRKFELPEKIGNNTEMASWYFLNVLDFFSCIDGCLTFEDYSNIRAARLEEPTTEEVQNARPVITGTKDESKGGES